MKVNSLNKIIKEELDNLYDITDFQFVKDIYSNNGNVFFVGGFVRDSFINKVSKDIDLLITGIPLDKLEEIIGNSGNVNLVGKSFGVLKFNPNEDQELELDIAIPRVEKSTGDKYTDFDVVSDHNLSIEDDLMRRDFTINSIAKDIKGNIIDPYNGVDDLKNKIIRMVNPEAFSDDPLRMLRAIQFSARFGFDIESNTLKEIQRNSDKIKAVPFERILIEFLKIVEKGDTRKGINELIQSGLYKSIFNKNPILNKTLNNTQINTMGEFIFCLLHGTLDNVGDFYLKSMKGDIPSSKQIKCLENLVNNFSTNSLKNKSVIYNSIQINDILFDTKILPNDIKSEVNDFESKYPKSLKELAVNGKDLQSLGFKGEGVGNKLKSILLDIFSDKIKNNKNDIMNSIEVETKENINENVNMINKISFYDFDATLCDSPMPETHKDIYKQKTGNDWPHVGWWGRPETLDSNIFDIKGFKNVINKLNIDNNNPSTVTILLTARISKLEKEIRELFNVMGLKIDEFDLKSNNKEKDERILDIITSYPDIKEIDVYDDREKEFVLFRRLRDTLGERDIKLNIYKCDNGNISLI